jgi:hypothetical protein
MSRKPFNGKIIAQILGYGTAILWLNDGAPIWICLLTAFLTWFYVRLIYPDDNE